MKLKFLMPNFTVKLEINKKILSLELIQNIILYFYFEAFLDTVS